MTQPAGQPQTAPVAGRAGYLSPEEQARRQAQDKQYDQGMNSTGVKVYQQRQQEDAATNAAAASGGYVMDVDAMRKFLPRWQSIADKLKDAVNLGQQLIAVDKPAEDEASTLQKQAADAHATAYLKSVREQQKYAQGYADRLKTAIDEYEKQEQAATDALRKHGRRA
ncbi:hypothetical protein OG738_44065 [Amycolatopsis sp. NBC_01488]|uniref:hypothetical protein n=1 Tax=Amycolatopsis sp. NBC_01488 TaxID=2903563 RepID=UPI002E29CB10|nr:hypothetical protein [Amycolatopsis sp. NBC_01488]